MQPPLNRSLHSHRSDTVTTLYGSDCDKKEVTQSTEYQEDTALHEHAANTTKRSHAMEIKPQLPSQTTTDGSSSQKHETSKITRSNGLIQKKQQDKLEREMQKLDYQSNQLQSVEEALSRAQKSIKTKDKNITKFVSRLEKVTDMLEEKQRAVDTLSEMLRIEQEENEQLQNKSITPANSSLYQDLIGKWAVPVLLDTSSFPACFSFDTISAPLSSCSSYVVITRVKPSITSLKVGDIVLEVNGYSCRGTIDCSPGIQQLYKRTSELRLVVARSCSISTSSSSSDDQFDTPPPLPLSPLPPDNLTSSHSSEDVLTNTNGVDSIKEKLSKLQSEYQDLKQRMEESQLKENAAREELTTKEMDRREASFHVTKLEAMLQNEKSEKDKTARRCQETEKAKQNLEENLLEARDQLGSLVKAKERENDRLKIELTELNENHSNLQMRYRDTTEKLKNEKSKHAKEISATESATILADERELANLRSKIDEMKQKSNKKIAELIAEVDQKDLAMKKMGETMRKLENEKETSEKQLDMLKVTVQKITEELEVARQWKTSFEKMEEEKDLLVTEVKEMKMAEEKMKQDMHGARTKQMDDIQLTHSQLLQQKEKELEHAQDESASLQLKVQSLEALQHNRMALLESDLQNFRKHSEKKEDRIAERDDQISQLHFNLKEMSLEQQREIQQKMKLFEETQTQLLSYKEKVQFLEIDKKMQQERLTLIENDLQSLRNQIEKKDDSIATKDTQITELNFTIKEQNTELRLLQQQVVEEKRKCTNLSKKYEKSQTTLARIESKFEISEQQLKKKDSEIETVTHERNDLKKEKAWLEKKLEQQGLSIEAEKGNSKILEKRLNQEIESLRAGADISKKQLEASQREALMYKDKAEALLSTMERDLQSTKQQSEKKDESVTEKDSQIIKLYSMVDQLNIETKSLQAQLKDQQDQVQSLSHSLKSATSEINTLRTDKEQSSALLQKQKTQLDEKLNEHGKLQKEAVELESIVTELRSSKGQLEAELAKVKIDSEKRHREMKSSMQMLKSEIQLSKSENESIVKENSGLSKQILEMEQRLSGLGKELSELKSKNDLERTNFEKEKKEMATKISSVEQQLATVNSELTFQKNSYASLENKSSTLSEQLGYVKAEKEKVDEKFTNATSELERVKANFEAAKTDSGERSKLLQNLLEEKENDITRTQGRLKSEEEKVEKANAEKVIQQQEMEQIKQKLEKELHQLRQVSTTGEEEFKEQVSGLKKELSVLQDNNGELTEHLNSSRQEAKKLTERSTQLQEHLDDLNEQYSQLEKAKEKCSEELSKEKESCLTLANSIEELKQTIKTLQEDYESKLSLIETKSKQVEETLRKEIEKLHTQKKNLVEEISHHKAHIGKLNDELKSLNEYIQRLLPVVMEFKPSVLAVSKNSPLTTLPY